MQILFSPAKRQEYGIWPSDKLFKKPVFLDEIYLLQEYLHSLSIEQISEIMKISINLAELNYKRIKEFNPESWNEHNSAPAILTFKGDAYKSLAADDFNLQQLNWSNNHVFIISGLYGLLRPLDPIKYYRLEMKTRLIGFRFNNLYDFWQDKLKNHILKINEPIINLASAEYFKAIRIENVMHIHFKCKKTLKTIGIKAKKARGIMLNWLIVNQINSSDQIKYFDLGYDFVKELSDNNNWVFLEK